MNTTPAQSPGQSPGQSPDQSPGAPRPLLARSDLIRFEHILTAMLERFFTFKAHSIYFPRENAAPDAPRWLGGERKVLIPLRLDGRVLGVFAGRGARLPRGLFPLLGRIADLCMENLALHKSNLTDSLTGLYTRDYLLDSLSGAIAQQRLRFMPLAERREAVNLREAGDLSEAGDLRGAGDLREAGDLRGAGNLRGAGDLREAADLSESASDITGTPPHTAQTPHTPAAPGGFEARNFAVLTVQLRGLQRLAADYGYLFLEKSLARLAAEFAALAPEGALAARISDGELGLYLPQGTPKTCRALGREIISRLAGLTFNHELSGSTVSIRAAAGYACFPQQAELPKAAHGAGAPDFPLDLDQARRILRKSRLAAYLAATEFSAASEGKILGFEQILSRGGRIREILPYGRARVNLGRDVGARVGQCFAIWGADPAQAGFDPLRADSTALTAAAYAGEMVLVSVDRHEATAELFHQADPARPVQRGDYLTLLPEGAFQYGTAAHQTTSSKAGAGQPELVPLSPESVPPQSEPDFLDFHTFTERLAMTGDNQTPCALALLRLDILNWAQAHDQPLNLSEITAQAAAICRAHLAPDTLVGVYGMHSFIFFHQNLAPEAALELYEGLAHLISEALGLDCACGIGAYPCLNYRRGQLLENCRKALDYALLLPGPKVGLFNSLALNISADKLFSQGDPFAAIQEYKQALLADETNSMAWISLGVCLAGVGRKHDARTAFERAIKLGPPSPQHVMALYNLGQIYQDLGEDKEAAAHYRRCLKNDPGHVYAALRLGQLAETAGRPDKARRWYAKAMELPGGKGPAQRRLARLALRQNDLDEAREHLHQALLADPQDAMALSLLAHLYLDAGEDAEVALALARQSVSLRPGIRANWQELARALDAAGREEDARQARRKAAEL